MGCGNENRIVSAVREPEEINEEGAVREGERERQNRGGQERE